MRSGIARLYKAMWYTQVGRALEQRDQLMDNDIVLDEIDDIINSKEDHIQLNEQTDRLIDNPEAVRGAYEDIIRDKQGNIQRYKQAIGQLIALVEQKKSSLKKLKNEIDKLEQMKEDAITKSKQAAVELKDAGIVGEEIKKHPKYKGYISSYNDFNSSIEEKQTRITKLEQDIQRAQNDIEEHKNSITTLHRDLEKVKTEQSEAVADFIAAREQEDINNILSGISTEDTSVELKRIREIREKFLKRS